MRNRHKRRGGSAGGESACDWREVPEAKQFFNNLKALQGLMPDIIFQIKEALRDPELKPDIKLKYTEMVVACLLPAKVCAEVLMQKDASTIGPRIIGIKGLDNAGI